jgi:hypothetical protein
MINSRAFHLILKHLHAIDSIHSTRLLMPSQPSETTLTDLLCELLDNHYQPFHRIAYAVHDLQQDLVLLSPSINVAIEIQTNKFATPMERYVSQSDLGLEIFIKNSYEPAKNRSFAYLLQAKKLFPTTVYGELIYTENSKFESVDADQEKRIRILQEHVGNAIKHLLYCPNPTLLEQQLRETLDYWRTYSIGSNIFDFLDGQELYKELNDPKTINAGIFISDGGYVPENLLKVHAASFHQTIPFSWFIALHFLERPKVYDLNPPEEDDAQGIVKNIINGDETAIDYFKSIFKSEKSEPPDNFKIYPKQTLKITYSVGTNIG